MSQASGKRDRSEIAPSNIAPLDDDRPLWSGFRWSVASRTVLVHLMMGSLTSADVQRIGKGGNFPGGNRSRQYSQLHANMCQIIAGDCEARGLEEPVKDLPSARAVWDTAKEYTRKFLQQGHVHDDAPNWAGKRVEQHLVTLQEMYQIIMAGYRPGVDGCDYDWSQPNAPPLVRLLQASLTDDEEDDDESWQADEVSMLDTESSSGSAYADISDVDEVDDADGVADVGAAGLGHVDAAADASEKIMPFRNIEQVYRMRPRFKHLVDNVLKLKTRRGALSMLQQAYPLLRKVTLTATKSRDHEKVQV